VAIVHDLETCSNVVLVNEECRGVVMVDVKAHAVCDFGANNAKRVTPKECKSVSVNVMNSDNVRSNAWRETKVVTACSGS
jgi:hypothetical protein